MSLVERIGLRLICCALLSATFALGRQAADQAADQVWAMEDKYCSSLQTGNSAEFMGLFSEDFLAWPMGAPAPFGKAQLAKNMHSVGSTSGTCSIEKKGIQVAGDTAVTYYVWRFSYPGKDGKPQQGSFRLTHTWVRANGQWTILGGMTAAEDVKPH
jgi:ketosteroid isomerase-like protein